MIFLYCKKLIGSSDFFYMTKNYTADQDDIYPKTIYQTGMIFLYVKKLNIRLGDIFICQKTT